MSVCDPRIETALPNRPHPTANQGKNATKMQQNATFHAQTFFHFHHYLTSLHHPLSHHTQSPALFVGSCNTRLLAEVEELKLPGMAHMSSRHDAENHNQFSASPRLRGFVIKTPRLCTF